MKKYESIPLEVEAIQFDGKNYKEVIGWADSNDVYVCSIPGLQIDTKEGRMTVSPGDYVVKEPFPTGYRDFYPVKPEIFENRYKEVK